MTEKKGLTVEVSVTDLDLFEALWSVSSWMFKRLPGEAKPIVRQRVIELFGSGYDLSEFEVDTQSKPNRIAERTQSIKIGDKIYPVIVDSDLEERADALGEINYRKVRILLMDGLEEQLAKEVLCHEAVHGMLNFIGEHETNRSEESVERITNGLLMLIRDNPDLFLKFARSDRHD